MLEPDYFQDKCDRMIEIFGELEDYILKDIAQRLLKSGMSGTADRLIWKLEQMGEHRSTILAKLSNLTKMSKQELRDLLQEAVLTSWKDDISTFNKLGIVPSNPLKNKAVMSVMNAEYIKSMGELENLTRTTLDRSQQDLIRMLDEAEIRVASGVQSYSAAICDILDNYAAGGVKISYPTGTERTLESAVRMAVVTSMNQTSAQVTNQYIVEGNIEYVLVSAHLGARPQKKGQPYLAGHENWQGRVYRIRGSEEGFPNLVEKTGYDITEDGVGRVVNPLGLHGYNCRHSHKPWDKDLRNPYLDKDGNLKIDKEESRKLYELQQKQRAMERAIRKTKRELLVKQQELKGIAETDIKEMLQPQYDKLAYKLREQNKAYKDFCEQNNLQTQQDRLKVAGFKRAQASTANGRATVYQNNLSSGGSIVNLITDKNIDNVKPVVTNGMDLETASKIQDAHKEILRISKDQNNSFEVAKLYDKDFNIIDTVAGTRDSVDLNISNRSKAMYVMHNHPNNESFSNRDIVWLIKNPQVKYFSIVKNSGDVEMIHILDHFDKNVMEIEYNRLIKKYSKEIAKNPTQGYNKVINTLLTKTRSGIEYVR